MIADISDNDVKSCARKTSIYTFANRTRYIVLILSIFALALVCSNSLALNFTIICMTKEPVTISESSTTSVHNRNSTIGAEEMFTSNERNVLFSVIAVGTLIGSVFITTLMARYGFRKVFVAYGVLSTLATLLMPLATLLGIVAVVFMRILQGVALSASFVAMGAISSEWSTIKTTGMFIAWISCHFQLGPMFTMPLAAAMCETWGWHWLYYIQGSLSLIVFALFFYFYRDSPRFQRHVSVQELTTIEKNKIYIRKTKTDKQEIPYRAILRDPFTWGFLSTMGAGFLSIQLISQFGPVYLNKALKINVKDTGLMEALPFGLSMLVKLTGGPLSDRLTYLSEKARVIMFASVSQFFMAACYVALDFLPASQLFLIQVFFTLVVIFSGLNAVGAVKGGHLAAQNFCHVLMAWVALQSSVVTLILPAVVHLFAPDDALEQWNRLFLFIAAIVVLTNIFFIATYTKLPRPFVTAAAEAEKNSEKSKNKF